MDLTKGLPRKGHKDRAKFLQFVYETFRECGTEMGAAEILCVSRPTMQHWLRAARTEGVSARDISLPKGQKKRIDPLILEGARTILLMSDMHIPYHDEEAVRLAIDCGKAEGCDTVILNGDIMDCGSFSAHEKTVDERLSWPEHKTAGRHVLEYVTSEFREAEKIYKEGNHELWLPRYIARTSDELDGMITMPDELWVNQYGYTWLPNRQRIKAGRLHIIHGNEYKGGGGVNVARTLYLKAADNVITGDKHRTAEYIHNTIGRQVQGAWVTGCLCELEPEYMTLNQWNLGFAIIEIFEDGNFRVQNRKIFDGRLY